MSKNKTKNKNLELTITKNKEFHRMKGKMKKERAKKKTDERMAYVITLDWLVTYNRLPIFFFFLSFFLCPSSCVVMAFCRSGLFYEIFSFSHNQPPITLWIYRFYVPFYTKNQNLKKCWKKSNMSISEKKDPYDQLTIK